MATIRRDKLMRLAAAGRLTVTESYQYDEMTGLSQASNERPVHLMADGRDFKDDHYNMRPDDFKGHGRAYHNEDGTVTLYVHSNHNVTFKVLPIKAVVSKAGATNE